MAADVGTGTTITFATDALTLTVMALKIGEVSVAVVDTTPLAPTLASAGQDGSETKIPGRIQRLGDITAEVQFEGGSAKRVKLRTVQTVTITHYDGTTYSGQGFIHSKGEISVDKDGLMTQTLQVARTGIWQ